MILISVTLWTGETLRSADGIRLELIDWRLTKARWDIQQHLSPSGRAWSDPRKGLPAAWDELAAAGCVPCWYVQWSGPRAERHFSAKAVVDYEPRHPLHEPGAKNPDEAAALPGFDRCYEERMATRTPTA